MIVAIDGPAASGKSSVARKLADRLGFDYVNSGSFYRAITWEVLRQGIDPEDTAAVAKAVEKVEFVCGISPDGESYVRTASDVSDEALRDESINRHVSAVSAVAEVRDLISSNLRNIAANRPVVMEGRDIGTAVFPGTPYKFYLDASPEIRQQRRSAQGQNDQIATRDRMDSSRQAAPLAKAADARVVDTSHLTLDGVVEAILEILKASGFTPPAR